eukprot:g58894.t1
MLGEIVCRVDDLNFVAAGRVVLGQCRASVTIGQGIRQRSICTNEQKVESGEKINCGLWNKETFKKDQTSLVIV